MNEAKYTLWLAEKKGPIGKTEVIEREYDIKSVADIGSIIALARETLFLYLGPYELGEVYGRTSKLLSFSSFMGVSNNYGYDVELFDKIMSEPMSLMKLFETVVTRYKLQIAENAEDAWMLLQNGWNSTYKVSCFVNHLKTSKESVIKDNRIFFIKKEI